MDSGTPTQGWVARTHPGREYYFEEGCFILELLNQPEDGAASVARVRVPVSGRTRWHSLRDTTERYLIVEGRGEVEVGDLCQTVAPGDVVVIPAGVRQRVTNTGADELVFLAICTPRFTRACYQDLEAD